MAPWIAFDVSLCVDLECFLRSVAHVPVCKVRAANTLVAEERYSQHALLAAIGVYNASKLRMVHQPYCSQHHIGLCLSLLKRKTQEVKMADLIKLRRNGHLGRLSTSERDRRLYCICRKTVTEKDGSFAKQNTICWRARSEAQWQMIANWNLNTGTADRRPG